MTPTNQRAVELAPCPFCASSAKVTRPDHMERIVLCDECGATSDYYTTEAEAIAAWNRRTPGWRPISEAPRDGRPIMVFNPNWSVKVGMAGWDAHENAWRVHGYGCVPSQPTLFQPPPPPPGEG